VKGLFLTNQLSAERTSSLKGDAADAGLEALEDVRNLQAKGSKNARKDLIKKNWQSRCMGQEKTKS